MSKSLKMITRSAYKNLRIVQKMALPKVIVPETAVESQIIIL